MHQNQSARQISSEFSIITRFEKPYSLLSVFHHRSAREALLPPQCFSIIHHSARASLTHSSVKLTFIVAARVRILVPRTCLRVCISPTPPIISILAEQAAFRYLRPHNTDVYTVRARTSTSSRPSSNTPDPDSTTQAPVRHGQLSPTYRLCCSH